MTPAREPRDAVGPAARVIAPEAAAPRATANQAPAEKAAPDAPATKKSGAKRAPAKKSGATKPAVTKSAVKKTAAKKPAARKTTAKQAASANKTPATKRAATKAASQPGARTTGEPSRHTEAAAPRAEASARRPSRRSISAAAGHAGTRRTDRPTDAPPLRVVPDPPESPADAITPDASGAGEFEVLINLLVEALRKAGSLVGIEDDDLEHRIAAALAFVRRRLTGDYEIDDFGFDQEFTDKVWLPILRPLYKRWFRVEVRGVENIPASGAALVVANHSGTLPIDGLMTQVAVHDEHPTHRHLRMLGADLVFESPLVGEFSRKSGTTLASNPDIERLFAQGELVAVFPEGFKGVGKPFGERYKLQRFGRGGFVAAALRAEVPIIPCAIVGAEEIYPMLGNIKGLARLLGFPYFPITPLFPLFGLAGLIPLPSKWIIEFGEPVDTASHGAAAADDPMLVFDLTDQVREIVQQSLHSLLLQRRSVFF
ncbi:glycerol acyltransferase [Flexivirga caeni]|uniref:Glycerol acyltransferase n=2 Tax=Flexivirga caeni TaxID=2294115 RepID=A0A3M9MIU3_9MICO|nr:glycerol acyltransferase [Flexivirga caeni]